MILIENNVSFNIFWWSEFCERLELWSEFSSLLNELINYYFTYFNLAWWFCIMYSSKTISIFGYHHGRADLWLTFGIPNNLYGMTNIFFSIPSNSINEISNWWVILKYIRWMMSEAIYNSFRLHVFLEIQNISVVS